MRCPSGRWLVEGIRAEGYWNLLKALSFLDCFLKLLDVLCTQKYYIQPVANPRIFQNFYRLKDTFLPLWVS